MITFLANTQRRGGDINHPGLRSQRKMWGGQHPVLGSGTNVVPKSHRGKHPGIIPPPSQPRKPKADHLCAIKVRKVRVLWGGRGWLTLGLGSLVAIIRRGYKQHYGEMNSRTIVVEDTVRLRLWWIEGFSSWMLFRFSFYQSLTGQLAWQRNSI